MKLKKSSKKWEFLLIICKKIIKAGGNVYIITDIKICCSEKEVLRVMKYNENNPNFNKVLSVYNEMYQKALSLAEVKGFFRLIPSPEIEFIKTENQLFIPCLVTLGRKISDQVTSLFCENEPLKAYILNIIADIALFNASEQMIINIRKHINDFNLKINISDMVQPETYKEDFLKIQEKLLNCFIGEEKLDVSITEVYMLNPVKSMTFYLEGDENNICLNEKSSCSNCNKANCDYKNHKQLS